MEFELYVFESASYLVGNGFVVASSNNLYFDEFIDVVIADECSEHVVLKIVA